MIRFSECATADCHKEDCIEGYCRECWLKKSGALDKKREKVLIKKIEIENKAIAGRRNNGGKKATAYCTGCHVRLTSDNTSPNKNAKTGLQSKCRKCRNAKSKERLKNGMSDAKKQILKDKKNGFKNCVKCGVKITIENTHKDASASFGLASCCKECKRKKRNGFVGKRKYPRIKSNGFCVKCGVKLTKNNASPASQRKTGFVSYCRDCINKKRPILNITFYFKNGKTETLQGTSRTNAIKNAGYNVAKYNSGVSFCIQSENKDYGWVCKWQKIT